MSLKELTNLKEGYDSGFDDILNEFYIPVLKEAKLYKRIAGFFSSSSLSVAARGITGLIKNNGHMQLIVSPRLSAEDIKSMEEAVNDPEEIISRVLLHDLNDLETLLQNRRLDALSWLLANGYLEIKVATIYDNYGNLMDAKRIEESGLFHIKVGIIEDVEGNILTFSGSVNESASAWVRNIEEFKVFKFWDEGQKNAAQIDIDKFSSYWDGSISRVKISELPEAVESKLVVNAPKDIVKIEEEILKAEAEQEDPFKLNFEPFEYQLEALQVWQKNHKAIFEMATGTGKTRTAQICIVDFLKKCDAPAVVFIICPQDTLAKQWLKDMRACGIPCVNYIICDSDSGNWKDERMGENTLAYKLLDLNVKRACQKKNLFVFSTFNSFCSKDFIETIKEFKFKSKYFIIGDEVHGLGSRERIKGLINEYEYRLGLSATPDRWFDEYGTKLISEFFGSDRYYFSLEDALSKINPITGQTYLTPYEYRPYFIELEEDEIYKYRELTEKITNCMAKAEEDYEYEELLKLLTFKRADIHKSAVNKLKALEEILDELSDNIDNTIIFTSPEQIDDVEQILRKRGILAKRFTSKQGNRALKKYGGISEREHIIKMFKEGDCQALIAIKCLDEGIDIPSAERAIILASSTNPREYIQRIGRVIRRSPGKKKAVIYDVIVEPSWGQLSLELEQYERKIFQKEMVRISEISENAENRLDIINMIYDRQL